MEFYNQFGPFAFMLKDRDGNEIPELFICRATEEYESGVIYHIFTWQDGKTIELLGNLGYRSGICTICQDNMLRVDASGTGTDYGTTIFYLPENADAIDLSRMDYVVDCIDTVTAKIELARRCHSLGVRLISSMGAANKMDPTGFRVSDISKTKMDPLAKAIRQKLRKMGIPHLKVVYSEETPLRPLVGTAEPAHTPTESQRRIPASNAFVPAAAGLVVGSEVVKDLIGYGRDNSC